MIFEQICDEVIGLLDNKEDFDFYFFTVQDPVHVYDTNTKNLNVFY